MAVTTRAKQKTAGKAKAKAKAKPQQAPAAKSRKPAPAAAAKKPLFIIRLNWVDCITICGIVLSSISAFFVFHGAFSFALSILFVAMLLDAIDGVLSRRFHLERDFGRYLDGFVDVYDYLILPSIFLWHWGFNTWYYGVILVGFMVSGVVRLSVFNQIGNIKNEKQDLAYLGMPVFWSVLNLGILYTASWLIPLDIIFPVVAVIFGVSIFFMVYNGEFYKFKRVKVMVGVLLGFATLFALDGFGLVPVGPGWGETAATEPAAAWLYPHLATAFLFILPLAIGGSLHMLAVSKDILPFLRIPVHRGLFGENKTWRGILLMPLLTVPGALLVKLLVDSGGWDLTVRLSGMSHLDYVVFGLLLGLGYILFELPNSFLKRRLGAKPGELPKRFGGLFLFLDQMDSTIGGTVVALIFYAAPAATAVCILVEGPLIALSVKQVLYLLRWKKESR